MWAAWTRWAGVLPGRGCPRSCVRTGGPCGGCRRRCGGAEHGARRTRGPCGWAAASDSSTGCGESLSVEGRAGSLEPGAAARRPRGSVAPRTGAGPAPPLPPAPSTGCGQPDALAPPAARLTGMGGSGTQKRLLLIGGGSGVGKTTVAGEVSEALRRREVAHCVVDGDYMGQVSTQPRPTNPSGRGSPNATSQRSGRTSRHAATGRWSTPIPPASWRRTCSGGPWAAGTSGSPECCSPQERPPYAHAWRCGRPGHSCSPTSNAPARGAVPGRAETPPGAVRVTTDGLTAEEVAAKVVAATGW